MWSVVAGALGARRGQAGVVALVAMLACGAVAVAGWYAAAASRSVAVATAHAAEVEQRLVSATGTAGAPTIDDPAVAFAPLDVEVVAGGQVAADLRTAGEEAVERLVMLAHRDDVCAHLAVHGDCPSAPGEVLLPATVAVDLGVAVGGTVDLATGPATGEPVRVVGTYRIRDPFHPYWGDRRLIGAGAGADAWPRPPDVLFAVPETVRADTLRSVSTYDLVVQPATFAAADTETLSAAVQAGEADLTRRGYTVTTDLPALVDRVATEQRRVVTGVAVGLALLLLLTWASLAVVFRSAADATRRDVAWWQLRGAHSGRGAVAALLPGTVPLLAGAALGTATGIVVGHRLVDGGASPVAAWRLTAGLVGATVAGAVLVAVITHLGTLRTPVRDLLRRVPARGRWAHRAKDLVVVALVAVAVTQALLAGPEVSGIGLLAPGLVGVGLALVASWALTPVAVRVARRALRAGRLGTALSALSVARRPGTPRLFALAAAAVALLTVALVGADVTARGQAQRATVELGAAQVVTVTATDPGQLLAAVRAADPLGHSAMAVVRTPARAGTPPVLAVDSTRLPVVAGWRDGYGGSTAQVAGMLRPPAPDPQVVATAQLAVEAAGREPDGRPVHLRVLLRAVDSGAAAHAVVGPLTPGRAVHIAPVSGCEAGCRLVGFELLGVPLAGGFATASADTRVDLYRLSDEAVAPPAPELVGPGLLADASRWRPAVGAWDRGPVITARDQRLTLTRAEPAAPGGEQPLLLRDDRVFLVDAPVPVPVVAAGWRPPAETAAEPRLPVLGGVAVPVQPTGTAELLPGLGAVGALVDLEYALRVEPFVGADSTTAVWLAPDADAAVLDRLRAAGLDPVRHETLEARVDQRTADGITAAGRFQVAVALVVLLLAAGAMSARLAAGRSERAAERVALRTQGVDERLSRAVGYGVPSAVVVAAVAVGATAGLVGAALARLRHPGFADGWALLPPPPPHPYPVALAMLVAVVVLAVAAVIAVATTGRAGPEGRP